MTSYRDYGAKQLQQLGFTIQLRVTLHYSGGRLYHRSGWWRTVRYHCA